MLRRRKATAPAPRKNTSTARTIARRVRETSMTLCSMRASLGRLALITQQQAALPDHPPPGLQALAHWHVALLRRADGHRPRDKLVVPLRHPHAGLGTVADDGALRHRQHLDIRLGRDAELGEHLGLEPMP